jgi:uncharacterized protein YbjT (DUF2867 family)
LITIFGASGNIGKPLAARLLEAGKQVRLITRNRAHLAEFEAKGAEVMEGDQMDPVFCIKAMEGAEVVHLLIPPSWTLTTTWHEYYRTATSAFMAGIQGSGVKKIVFISSQGSHDLSAGPVGFTGEFELELEKVDNIDLVILRPGYFFQNLYGMAGMIAHMNILGSSTAPDKEVSMIHTNDIAEVAAEVLSHPESIQGISRRFIVGPKDLTMVEVAKIIGTAIGNENLPYVPFSYEDSEQGMIAQGIPATIAEGYSNLMRSINEGRYFSDYNRDTHVAQFGAGPTTLEQFAEQEFAPYLKSMMPTA